MIKALTIQPPWSWAVAIGVKGVENRTTLWKHRGLLAIHAGTRISERGMAHPLVRDAWDATSNYDLDEADRFVWDCGHIVAVTTVADVHRCAPDCCQDEWAEESYTEHGGTLRGDVVHLVLWDTIELPTPVPVKGNLGLWTVPDDAARAVLDQTLSRGTVEP